MPGQADALWPLGLYVLAVVVMIAGILAVSFFLGQRHRERATGQQYESGMLPTGSARLRFSADFYLIAMFFVIFDLETVFVFAWAVAAREVGWKGYGVMAVFVTLLLAALAYLWRSGALNWGHAGATNEHPTSNIQGPTPNGGQASNLGVGRGELGVERSRQAGDRP